MSDDAKTVPPAVAERITPPDTMPGRNGGTLHRGGNEGGRKTRAGGMPPSQLRAKMRGALAKRLDVARRIADDPKATNRDRLHALDFLAKYGLGTTITETDNEGRDVIRVIREPRRLTSDN